LIRGKDPSAAPSLQSPLAKNNAAGQIATAFLLMKIILIFTENF